MKVIAVAMPKGGVGKTTISISICDELSAGRQKKVLAIDTDAQGGLSALLGCKPEESDDYNLWGPQQVLLPSADLKRTATALIKPNRSTIQLHGGKLDVIPVWTGMDSALGRVHLANRSISEARTLNNSLRRALSELNYEYVVIDTPGSPNEATQTILGLADLIVVPVIPEELSYRMLLPFMTDIRKRTDVDPEFSPSVLVVFSKVQFIEGHKEFLDTKPQELRVGAPVQKLHIAQHRMIQRNGFALRTPSTGHLHSNVSRKYRDANYPFVKNLVTEILETLKK